MREITLQDVRLAVGEGKLTPGDVLAGCNAELRRREQFAKNAKKSGDVMERARGLLDREWASSGYDPAPPTVIRAQVDGRKVALRAIAAALTHSHDQVAAAREEVAAMTAWKDRVVAGYERAERRVSELLAWKMEAQALLPTQPDREPSDG